MNARTILFVAVAGGLLASRDAGSAGGRHAPARRLPEPEHLTSETRAALTARMGRHGETMSTLVRAVVLLDRPTIRALAGRIADEEVIARASKSVHEPPPIALPGEFFLQQTKLTVAARDLAAAAAEGSEDRVLAERFGIVTSTCVACHGAYLHDRPDAGTSGRHRATPARR